MSSQTSDAHSDDPLALILSGPMLRGISTRHVTIWLVSCDNCGFSVDLWADNQVIAQQDFAPSGAHVVRIGTRAWVYCLTVQTPTPLPFDTWLEYDLCKINPHGLREQSLFSDTCSDVCYPGASRPRFVLPEQIHQLLHGSCRKPHFPGADGLCTVDDLLMQARTTAPQAADKQPSALIMTGDQVYLDDVAGPMLSAIRQVIDLLGLYQEPLKGSKLTHSDQLDQHAHSYYQRMQLLPDLHENKTLRQRFFGGVRKPIFTTQTADNHIIALSEVMAMYLLVWSPVLWRHLSLEVPELVAEQYHPRYAHELSAIEQFRAGLKPVRRALANIPTYMIFDDHDITDDWNLSRSWEETAYEHPFSRRIIGNALLGYSLCQAWGNRPHALPDKLLSNIQHVCENLATHDTQHDALISKLLSFEGWSYTLDSTPKILVLDTRTRRWRAESRATNPSGLMDWESLSEMQQSLIHEPAVILVSPAPVFGVKLIEVIQKVFTWFGQSLLVDAENWMAHPGSANVVLNIFRHKHTPNHFTILSGDVHYSFVYDVTLRHRETSPHIWQITSSGIRNGFPVRLLRLFDRLNRMLYASHSPLNWFTRRRHMRVKPRRPSDHPQRYPNQRLLNGSGIGRVTFDRQGAPCLVEQILHGDQAVHFKPGYESDWVH